LAWPRIYRFPKSLSAETSKLHEEKGRVPGQILLTRDTELGAFRMPAPEMPGVGFENEILVKDAQQSFSHHPLMSVRHEAD
jgi:hypothetical protein